MVAKVLFPLIMTAVSVASMVKSLALAGALIALGTGCSGLATTQSVSPIMFFLPGLGVDSRPVSPQIVPLVKNASPAQTVASNKGSSHVN
jgi:hypothetical protein